MPYTRLAAAAVLAAAALGAAPGCDRACMTGLVDRYVAALGKHYPAVGDGLWVSASEVPNTFKIYAVDPASSQVAFYGVMKELNKPLIVALRLKVIHGEITEIEHVVARNMRPDRMQNLVTPRPALPADVSDSDKTPREEM